jgi:hypothetical protein
MAEDEKKCPGELSHISVCRAENGWKIICMYSAKETLSQRAGWTPCAPCESKDWVEKTDAALLDRMKKIISCKCGNC